LNDLQVLLCRLLDDVLFRALAGTDTSSQQRKELHPYFKYGSLSSCVMKVM